MRHVILTLEGAPLRPQKKGVVVVGLLVSFGVRPVIKSSNENGQAGSSS